MAATTAREAYLANLSLNIADLRRRLEDSEGTLFLDDDINVRITDIGNDAPTSRIYNDEKGLWQVINEPTPNTTRMRIISIYSERTIEPLQISSDLMCGILHKYNVHPDFLRVLFSFGEEPHLAEASSGNLSIHCSGQEETHISYQINYVEENYRKGQDPWSFRHTGIYHHHTLDFDLYILLHPNKDSIMETAFFKILGLGSRNPSPQSQISNFYQEPYRLHLLLLSSFFDNWRWYFRYLGNQFTRENNQAMVVKPENADAKSSFWRVQNLRNINDFALFARACCMCDLKVVEDLEGSAIKQLKDASDLQAQAMTLREYVESSGALESRIRNALDLVGYTLTLHHHLETAKVDKELRDITHELRDMTEKMKNLTQDTVDDSATVKIITYFSAFYLPGSFVASMYGMNFFVFDATSHSIAIGDDFWIFIATWLPLTAITVVIYILTLWFVARRKGKRGHWLWSRRKPQSPPENLKE